MPCRAKLCLRSYFDRLFMLGMKPRPDWPDCTKVMLGSTSAEAALPFDDLEPFGRENKAQSLTEASIKEILEKHPQVHKLCQVTCDAGEQQVGNLWALPVLAWHARLLYGLFNTGWSIRLRKQRWLRHRGRRLASLAKRTTAFLVQVGFPCLSLSFHHAWPRVQAK